MGVIEAEDMEVITKSGERRRAERRNVRIPAIACTVRRVSDPNSFFIGEIRNVSKLAMMLSLSCTCRLPDKQFIVGERMLIWYFPLEEQSLLISVGRLRRVLEHRDRTYLAAGFESFDARHDEYLARIAGSRLRRSKADMGLPGYGIC